MKPQLLGCSTFTIDFRKKGYKLLFWLLSIFLLLLLFLIEKVFDQIVAQKQIFAFRLHRRDIPILRLILLRYEENKPSLLLKLKNDWLCISFTKGKIIAIF